MSTAPPPPPFPPALPGAVPARPLVVLTVAVVLAHLLALHLLPAGLPDASPAAPPAPVFATRVVPPPAPPSPAPQPVAAPRPPPRPRPPPPVSAPAPVPALEAPAGAEAPGTADDAAGPPAPPGEATTATAAPAAPEPAPSPPEPPAAPPPPPVGVPGPVRLRYDVEGFARKLTYHARSELLWQQDGTRYEARLELSAFLIGSRVQTSTGRIGPAGLLPERFSDKARSELASHFDYENQRIVFSANTPQVPLPPGAQDRLGLFLQLGALLAGAPDRYPPGAAITLPTVGPRDLAEWTFNVAAPEKLSLAAGEFDTVRLERAPRKDYDTRVEVWYAPALGYLPVRIRITQSSGDFVDQKLQSLGHP